MIYRTIQDVQKAGLGKWVSHCQRGCGASFELFVRVQSNGIKLWNIRCLNCKDVLGGAIAYRNVPSEARLSIPIEIRPDPGQSCARCGEWKDGVELHHWAPWEFFIDAWKWPTSYLCRSCHGKWHKIMREQKNTGDCENGP